MECENYVSFYLFDVVQWDELYFYHAHFRGSGRRHEQEG